MADRIAREVLGLLFDTRSDAVRGRLRDRADRVANQRAAGLLHAEVDALIGVSSSERMADAGRDPWRAGSRTTERCR